MVFLYILFEITAIDPSNFVFLFLNIFLLCFIILLVFELLLLIIFYFCRRWYRARKKNQFVQKLEHRKPFLAIHATTGQKHRFFAIDRKHAEEILKKTGTQWTVFVEDKRKHRQ